MKSARLAIFASGGGSNAYKICEYFQDHVNIVIAGILTNRKEAGVLQVADKFDIPAIVVDKNNLSDGVVENWLHDIKADMIILAGFLLLIPAPLITKFPNRILNIHPSLLPKYGGKGMHGHHVHEAVVKNDDTITGMTIHVVNEKYDDGQIIFQAKCAVKKDDTAEIVASNVLALEHFYYSKTIENYINGYLSDEKTN